MALNLAPFGRWTLRDKAAQRRLALRFLSVRFPNWPMSAKGRLHSVTKGYYREAKLQRQLYGDEPEEM